MRIFSSRLHIGRPLAGPRVEMDISWPLRHGNVTFLAVIWAGRDALPTTTRVRILCPAVARFPILMRTLWPILLRSPLF
jgi:hypothetical protein